jgi:hypothetical protein
VNVQSADSRNAETAAKPTASTARHLVLQRKCACGGDAGLAGDCEECSTKRFSLQRRSSSDARTSAIPASVEHTLVSPGRALDGDVRNYMEDRFGHDFAGVRVHDDASAAASARDVDAHAYTVGQHIVFDHGRYEPQTTGGRHLLAHELAHTIQQEGLQRAGTDSLVDQGPDYRRLEADADRMAAAALGGAALPPSHGAQRLTLSRAARKLDDGDEAALTVKKKSKKDIEVSSSYMTTKHTVTPESAFERTDQSKNVVRQESFAVDTLFVPSTKGPNALATYESMAGSGLQATLNVEGRTKAVLWQERADTGDLQGRWLQGVGWPGGKQADALWQQAGGDATFPKVGGVTCQMDHIVELQIGGNNTNENIQALDPEQNRDSGGAIKNQVFMLAEKVATDSDLSSGKAEQITFRFKSVKAKDTNKGKGEVLSKKCPPKPATCLSVESCARKSTPAAATGAAAARVDYEISAGGAATTLKVDSGFAKNKAATAAIKDDPLNSAAAELIPGMLLDTLHHRANGGEAIAAEIDTREKTRLPLAIEGKKTKFELNVGKDGKLKLAQANTNLNFTYRYLSPGAITKLGMGEDGQLQWQGHINPSVPFLGRLDVSYEKGELKVSKGLEPNKIKSPIPGVKLVKADVSLFLAPEFKPEGTLEVQAGADKEPLAKGVIKIGKDDNGLVARGDLLIHLPGVDETKLSVVYDSGGWSGEVSIQSTQIKIPYVESGALTVRVAPKVGVTADGKIGLGLPGGNKAEVGLKRQGEKWMFSGSGRFKLPKLDEAEVHVSYDGETLVARGRTSFTFHSLRGTLDPVTYTVRKGEAGTVTGTGKLDVSKGRVTGNITVNLLPTGRFSGEGKVTVRITDKLSASAGIVVDQEEKVRLSGEMRIEVIELFKGVQGEKNLFDIEKNIPIPGASIPGVGGLMAKIGGGVNIGYGIGPGVLRNVFIEAAFNPLEENPDVDAGMGGRLEIPAYAKFSGYIKGGVALDVTVAEVSGFLTVTVSLTLNGGLAAEFKGRYAKNRFVVDAYAEIFAALILGLGLDATVRAKVIALGEKSKTWNLKHLDVPTGLDFKLRAPIHYASDESFKAPTMDSIEFSPPPKIDPGDLLGRIFRAAGGTETGAQGA